MSRAKRYLSLVLAFLKIGLFTFGGGYAMIALIEREFVEKQKLIDDGEFTEVVAIAESTPGPIAINAATYIGYKTAKLLGAVLSTIAVCLPSFVIVYAISLFFDSFLSLEPVKNAFKGIQVAVAYLIITAGLRMLKKKKKGILFAVLLSTTFVLMAAATLFSVKVSSVLFIGAGAAVGVIINAVKNSIKETKEGESAN